MSSRLLGPVVRWLRATALPLATFGGTLLAAVAGFVVLADVSVIDATFWVLDPTSIELHFASHAGPERAVKAYALGVFAVLILSGVWIGESVLDAAFDGRLREGIKRMQDQRTIDDLTDHVVICGHGMFGRTVAERLRERGRTVVIVENDDAEIERIDDDCLLVTGDARREEVLADAGVDRAAAVVAAIDDSNVNIQIGVIADQLAPEAHLVVRVGDEVYESTARRVGADTVVIPEVVSGGEVVESL